MIGVVYSWDSVPNFDIVGAAKSGSLLWWNEKEVCLLEVRR